MAKENTSTQQSDDKRLEAIKQIIFGQNMEQYDREFHEIREYITNNLNAIDKEFTTVRKQLDDMDKRINEKLDKQFAEIMAEIKRIDEAKMDRRKLGKLLADISEKISA